MKVFRILLTGGEPMLRGDFFDIIKKLHQKMCIILSTNGNFINDDNVEELTKYIKYFAISMDGATSENHDIFRGVNGSFDKAIGAIHKIGNIGDENIKLAINTTLGKYNISEIEKIIDLAVSFKAKTIRFSTIYPKGRALENTHIYLDNNEVKNAISRILQKKKILNCIEISFDDSLRIPLKLHFNGYSEDTEKEEINYQKKGCGVAHTSLSIMPDGAIIPCEFYQESPEFLIGNALKDDISRLWIQSKPLNEIRKGIKNPEICKSCKHENICISIRCDALVRTNNYWCTWYESIM